MPFHTYVLRSASSGKYYVGYTENRFSLPIADCRLSIEEVVWQLAPLSIGNRQSKIGNSRHPGPNHDRRDSSQDTKNLGIVLQRGPSRPAQKEVDREAGTCDSARACGKES